jgi:hypothetical protein
MQLMLTPNHRLVAFLQQAVLIGYHGYSCDESRSLSSPLNIFPNPSWEYDILKAMSKYSPGKMVYECGPGETFFTEEVVILGQRVLSRG